MLPLYIWIMLCLGTYQGAEWLYEFTGDSLHWIAMSAAMFVVAVYFLRFAWPLLDEGVRGVPASGALGLVLLLGGVLLVVGGLRRLSTHAGRLLKTSGVALLSGSLGSCSPSATPIHARRAPARDPASREMTSTE